jgi:hypothetical protein
VVFVVASQKNSDVVTAAAQATKDGNAVVVFLDPSKLGTDSKWGKYAQQLVDTHNRTSGTTDQSVSAVFGTYKDANGQPTLRANGGSFMDREHPLQEYNAGLRELIKQHGPVHATPQSAEVPIQQPVQQSVQYQRPYQYEQPVQYQQPVQYEQPRRGLFGRRR